MAENQQSKKTSVLRIVDIISKSQELGFFKREEIVAAKIDDGSNQTPGSPDITKQSVDLMISRGFLDYDKLMKINQAFAKFNPAFGEPIEKIEGVIGVDAKNKKLPSRVMELFSESVSDFKFFEDGILIHDIDPINKKIYVLIPYPCNYFVERLKDFRARGKSMTEERGYLAKNPDGTTSEVRAIAGTFNFKVGLAHVKNVIGEINAKNYSEKQIEKSSAVLNERIKAGGYEGVKTNKIESIAGSAAAREGTVRGILADLLEKGEQINCSDYHFEPYLHDPQNKGRIRFRVNGKLGNEMELLAYKTIVDEIKSMCKGMSSDSSLPNDGKLEISLAEGRDSSIFRVSTLPIGEMGQEKVVLRKLEKDSSNLSLETKGMDRRYIEKIEEFIGDERKGIKGKYQNGLFLMTGPTGSGKSTTLFCILNQLNTPDINIITLEDPIEYQLPGLNQSKIGDSKDQSATGKKYTFASGIRACMRQDPNIILVGEIRDPTTMEAAVEAATTGQKVFSTLHTNSTWETLDRMAGLGLDIHLVASTIRLIMAQRLNALVCPHCIREYEDPCFVRNEEELQRRIREGKRRKREIISAVMDTEMILEMPDRLEDMKIYQGKGCNECGNTKISGRSAVLEIMPIDLEIQEFLLENTTSASKKAVGQLFIKKGIYSLFQEMMYKVVAGVKIKGTKRYFDYDSAIVGSGGNQYGFGSEYMQPEYDDMDKFNEVIAKKKKERKNAKFLNLIRTNEFEIQALTKSKNETNEQFINREIARLLKENDVHRSQLIK